MKSTLLWLAVTCFPALIFANPAAETSGSEHTSLNSIVLKKNAGAIQVVPVSQDPLASSFVIFVRKFVAPHVHKDHTELLYVLEGEAKMALGNTSLALQPGTYVEIPKGTVHSVEVTSTTPLKVLSIQTPRFEGKDRHYVRTSDQ